MSHISSCDLRNDAGQMVQPVPPIAGRVAVGSFAVLPAHCATCPELRPRRPPRLADDLQIWLIYE